ncbi:hypothetical protein LTR95_001534 [Oleoguttula sp. CCFEE 5521]
MHECETVLGADRRKLSLSARFVFIVDRLYAVSSPSRRGSDCLCGIHSEQSLRSRTACPYATPAELAFERNAIYAAKLVPDLIPSFYPTLRVDASYPSQKVNYGNTFTTLRE